MKEQIDTEAREALWKALMRLEQEVTLHKIRQDRFRRTMRMFDIAMLTLIALYILTTIAQVVVK